jgi:hypothetical protein
MAKAKDRQSTKIEKEEEEEEEEEKKKETSFTLNKWPFFNFAFAESKIQRKDK